MHELGGLTRADHGCGRAGRGIDGEATELPIGSDRAQWGCARDLIVGDVVDLELAGVDLTQDEIGPAGTNAQVLGTDQFPAPAAQTWSAVAIALGQGLSSLESIKLWLIFAGGVVGVLLTFAPVLLPKYQEYLPSASAFGLAWVFPWYHGLLFFLGALIALLLKRRKPKLAEEFTLPVASGVVAGGSLMGVVLVFWANGGSILNKLLGG